MRVFLLAFFGKTAATAFIAVCIALGFGPPEWAKMILGFDPTLVWRAAFIALGVVPLIVLIWPSIQRRFSATALPSSSVSNQESADLIRAQTDLEKQRRLLDKQQLAKQRLAAEQQRPVLSDYDRQQRELAGIVAAMMERALKYGFRLPDETFAAMYRQIDESSHHIWADAKIRQLRRDFLNRCGIMGERFDSAQEEREARAELQGIGDSLTTALLGRPETSAQDDTLPLLEAATAAYSATEDSDFANLVATMRGHSIGQSMSDKILERYAAAIVKYSTVLGSKEPATNMRPQTLSGYDIEKHDGKFRARKRHGTGIIGNLRISQTDLTAFIERVRNFPGQTI